LRNTKIVCTLGPNSNSPELIGRLLEAGMDVVRLNFSHGTQADHAVTIERLRASAAAEGRFVPVIADLQGPRIRTGPVSEGQPVELLKGSFLRLTCEDGAVSRPDRVSIDFPLLAEQLHVGDRVLLAEGEIELQVSDRSGADVVCQVIHGGRLGARKGVNLPGVALAVPSITEKDKGDLQFALAQQVDYIALSFVRAAKDVRLVKSLIQWAGTGTPVIAKLEKPQALDHLDEILVEADGVMVARGDLGVELSPARVPVEQKRIIARAAALRKPVITATQMLESMIHSPRPTRAEASDVANAVFDGSDALMLSGETAIGQFPLEAVTVMSEIIQNAEASEAWQIRPLSLRALGRVAPEAPLEISDAVAETAVSLTAKLGVKALVVYTESGYTARLVSKHRPGCPILGLSRHRQVCLEMGLLWGLRPRTVGEISDVDHLALAAESILLNEKLVARGDLVCLVAGTPFAVPGKTDLIKLHRVGYADQ